MRLISWDLNLLAVSELAELGLTPLLETTEEYPEKKGHAAPLHEV